MRLANWRSIMRELLMAPIFISLAAFSLLAEASPADPTEAIKAAAGHSWEAALLATIVISSFVFFGIVARQMLARHLSVEERTLADAKEREGRMASRLTELEVFIRDRFAVGLDRNTVAMNEIHTASCQMIAAAKEVIGALERHNVLLQTRFCLISESRQREAVREYVAQLVKDVKGDP
jgi:hypothetical protein